MIKIGAIPDDHPIHSWAGKVKAILLSHAHLDHIAAVPYLASKYKCPVLGTPYTIEILKATLKDKNKRIPNKLIALKPNKKHKIAKSLAAEFIPITHSTPHSTLVALYTKEGAVLYANDFKLDNTPVLENPPDYKKIKSLSPVKCLIIESLYSSRKGRTPSEQTAKRMLQDVLLNNPDTKNAVIITTFSSQIARIKSIIEIGKKLNREIVILGRSMHKYITAAENLNIVKFTDKASLFGFSSKIKKMLKKIQKNRSRYIVVCTGNQAERGSVLHKMAHGYFSFKPNDHVVFSCRTIPTEPNITQRKKIELLLKRKKVKLSLDVHASGHSSVDDLRDLILLSNPEHIIPAHQGIKNRRKLAEIANSSGYKNTHLPEQGSTVKI